MLLGGWFLYVAVSAYGELPSRAVSLPEEGKPELLLDDFVVFYAAGKYVPEIGNAVYDPTTISAFEAKETKQSRDSVVVLPFFNPPSALLLFTLLGVLPLGLAAVVWLSGSAVLAFFSTRRLMGGISWSHETTLLVVLGIASWLPLYQAIVHGQMTFLLLAGFCLFSYGLLQPGKETYSAVGLLLLAFKPIFLPLPLLYLVLKGQFRLLLVFAAVEGALVLCAALLFGPRLPIEYVSMSIDALSWDEVNGISTYGMFGWTGFWRGVIGPDSHGLQMALATACSVATVIALVPVFWRGGSPRLALAGVILGSLLISPHSYAQDLLLLTLPLLLLLEHHISNRASAAAALALWFAAYFHFDALATTGVGAANLGLVLLTGFVLLEALGARAEFRMPRAAHIRTRASLDSGLSSADAGGS